MLRNQMFILWEVQLVNLLVKENLNMFQKKVKLFLQSKPMYNLNDFFVMLANILLTPFHVHCT